MGEPTTPTISLHVNGETVTLTLGASVADLVQARGLQPSQVAVELNRDIVPRAQHGDTRLSEGDRVEIVTMVGGG